jgi:hypothetical protein
VRKTLGATVSGLVIVASAALGAGTASAAVPSGLALPSQQASCSRALLPLLSGTQKQLCEAALGLTGAVGSTASSAVQSVPRVVQSAPRVVTRDVPRVVQGAGAAVGGTVSRATGGSASSATRSPSGSSTSSGSASSGRSSATPGTAGRPAAAANPLPAGVPVAPTQNYDTLMSSAYDRVPTGLLGTAPSGGAGASLIAPASFDPSLLLSGRPTRTLGGPENGVTTSSTAGPAFYTAGDRVGTPMLVGVLVLSSALALLVRTAVLRRSPRGPATA